MKYVQNILYKENIERFICNVSEYLNFLVSLPLSLSVFTLYCINSAIKSKFVFLNSKF